MTTWRNASIAGLVFAVGMCLWVGLTRDVGLDHLAIRFAIYFTTFTTGYYYLTNFYAARHRGPD